MDATPTRRVVGVLAASAALCSVAAACTARARRSDATPSAAASTGSGTPAARPATAPATSITTSSTTTTPPTTPPATTSAAGGGGRVGAGSDWSDPGWVRAENRRPGSADWAFPATRTAGPTELAAYASRTSVLPGQPFTLFVTATAGSYTVHAHRLGWYGGAGARLVWASGRLRGRRQPRPSTDSHGTVRCDWTPSLQVATTDWPPGSYLLRLTTDTGRATHVPLTVSSPAVAGRLVLVSAVATYQAYNQWGGHSLYRGPDGAFATRASAVSFDRPYDEDGARVVEQYEAALVSRAERLGLPLAYLTGLQLDDGPDTLRGAAGVVSLGHDEYWTTGMRASATRARDTATNVAFLGANAVYWRIRLADRVDGHARTVVCHKDAATDPVHGPTTTTHWRSAPAPDPENSLVGSLYEDFPAVGALVVTDPGFFLFRRTGARRGSAYPGIVGSEINRAYPVAGTPADLRVVAHSPVTGPAGRTHADMTYYSVPSGAGVFCVGTMGWNKAVRGPSARFGTTAASAVFARTVTDELFTAMAAGPMGRANPSVGNLASLHEPSSTATGTGGGVAASSDPPTADGPTS